jgi:23S rRNA (cytidine1920-2'-O)/16S rRNA (cytidine1409-2'-O)-methyltransferase
VAKVRLDQLLVQRGIAESRAKAQALIMAGQVRVRGQVSLKAGATVAATAEIEVEQGPRFVSRGGEKLEAALQGFRLEVRGCRCADVGASTGGFTDCLLQHGAAKVYAIDVGKGVLHWKLRGDSRVVVMEETNARLLQALPEAISLVTIDASFISLRLLLPVAKAWLAQEPPTEAGIPVLGLVALVKPQFEAGRKEAQRGAGVIRSTETHRQVLLDVLDYAQQAGLGVRGLLRSPLLGPKGNVEFLVWLDPAAPTVRTEAIIEQALSSPARPAE